VHTSQPGADSNKAESAVTLDHSVTWFHPPLNTTEPLKLNLDVHFPAGRLTQYYPYAHEVRAKQIVWKEIYFGMQADPFQTSSTVWVAPRAVGQAATLKVYMPGPAGSQPEDPGTTEGEVFLYFRGAGDVPSPIEVTHVAGQKLALTLVETTSALQLASVWLVEVRNAGGSAFRHLDQLDSSTTRSVETRADFAPDTFVEGAVSKLVFQMREALNAEGLHDDEAAALLRTIEQSHLRAPGRRVLFILPRSWIDAVVPFQASGPVEVRRRITLGTYELTGI
jgi:hypothetical protein